jgi:hypothetical protein
VSGCGGEILAELGLAAFGRGDGNQGVLKGHAGFVGHVLDGVLDDQGSEGGGGFVGHLVSPVADETTVTDVYVPVNTVYALFSKKVGRMQRYRSRLTAERPASADWLGRPGRTDITVHDPGDVWQPTGLLDAEGEPVERFVGLEPIGFLHDAPRGRE